MGRDVSDLWDRSYESTVVTVVGGHGCGGSVFVFVSGGWGEAEEPVIQWGVMWEIGGDIWVSYVCEGDSVTEVCKGSAMGFGVLGWCSLKVSTQ